MKALIIYDSAFGNTAKIADAVARTLNERFDTVLSAAADTTEQMVDGIDLLVVGSPTQGGRATVDVQEFINKLPSLNDASVAAFDTRFAVKAQKFFLRMLMKTIGYAANKIASALKAKGGNLVAEPEGFIVEDKEGPLKAGELDRAQEWASQLTLRHKTVPAGLPA